MFGAWSRSRLSRAAFVTACAAIVIAAEVLLSPASAAGLTLIPNQGTPGTRVSMTGDGFPPNTPITICWVGPGGTCQVQLFSGRTSADGLVSAQFVVPNDTPGPHTVDATAGAARAAATFTVSGSTTSSPAPTLAPTQTPTANVSPCRGGAAVAYPFGYSGGSPTDTGSRLQIGRGETFSFVINALAVSPLDAVWTFAAEASPPGPEVMVAFAPARVGANGQTRVTVGIAPNAPAGTYVLRIRVFCNGSEFVVFSYTVTITGGTATPTPAATPTPTPSPTAPTPIPPPPPTPTPTPSIPPTPTPTPTPVLVRPPELVPPPCPPTDLEGWVEPAQGVWQDDPYFPDKPGKQITRLSPTSYRAELDMVKDRNTLLFGVIRPVGEPEYRDRRNRIAFEGTARGSIPVQVKMEFSYVDAAGRHPIWTSPILPGQFPSLDGPCGEPGRFSVWVDARDGIPPRDVGSFTFPTVGPYRVEVRLLRADGSDTGIIMTVEGKVRQTRGPRVQFMPLLLSLPPTPTPRPFGVPPANPIVTFRDDAKRLAYNSGGYIPDFFPLPPGGLPTFVRPVRTELADTFLNFFGGQLTGLPLLTKLAEEFGTAAVLGGADRVVTIIRAPDWGDYVRPGILGLDRTAGFTVNQKTIFTLDIEDYSTVAHELVHTLPYLWSGGPFGGEMKSLCGTDYHNSDKLGFANGHQVVDFGQEQRRRLDGEAFEIMEAAVLPPNTYWISQCTYWHLLDVLVNPPDPPVTLVHGFVARNGLSTPLITAPATSAGVSGTLGRLYQFDSVTDLQPGSDGDWAIVLRDANGAVLERFPFEPVWEQSESDEETDLTTFIYRVPDLPGAASLELVGPGGVLDQRTLAVAAPSVAITTPISGATIGRTESTVRVEWQATDPSDLELRAIVFYSPDGGENWYDVAYETTATTFDVPVEPTDAAPAIRVVVTNGSRSAEAVVRLTISAAGFGSDAPPRDAWP